MVSACRPPGLEPALGRCAQGNDGPADDGWWNPEKRRLAVVCGLQQGRLVPSEKPRITRFPPLPRPVWT